MKNKKGFTLMELLAVIAIIALISLVAIPNIVGLSTGVRQDQMLDDAKKLISLAKYEVNKSYAIRSNPPHTFTFTELNTTGDLDKDPDNGQYVEETSYVRYEKVGTTIKYCVYLEGSIRKVCRESNCGEEKCPCTECVYEDNLHSRNNVVDKQ